MSKVNTIIFSPHIDDEVLGCFSWLKPCTLVLVAGVEDRQGIPTPTEDDVYCNNFEKLTNVFFSLVTLKSIF